MLELVIIDCCFLIKCELKQMSLSLDMKNDLLSIILEEIFSTGITIKYSDFSLLLDEICCHLPGEEKCKVKFS